MDNALLALYGWFTLALFVIFAVTPLSSSAVAMALWSALSLALSAHIAWRGLHWVPVEGEVVEVRGGGPGSASWSFSWRWAYGGVTHTATDVIGDRFLPLFNRIGRGTRATVWVDPRDPSCLLPPTWRSRLSYYLVGVIMGAYGAARPGAPLGLTRGPRAHVRDAASAGKVPPAPSPQSRPHDRLLGRRREARYGMRTKPALPRLLGSGGSPAPPAGVGRAT